MFNKNISPKNNLQINYYIYNLPIPMVLIFFNNLNMSESKTKAQIAFKKAKSSLEKIEKMIDNDEYCIKIIQQNLAVIWLIKSVNLKLLEWHLDCCIKKSIIHWDKKDLKDKFDEIIHIMKTFQNK